MKTYNTVATETDIKGVDSNEELIALFAKALELSQHSKTSQENLNSLSLNTQCFPSEHDYRVLHTQSDDLKPIALPEIDFQECLQNMQLTLTQIKEERENEIQEDEKIECAEVEEPDDIENGSNEKDLSFLRKTETICSTGKEVQSSVYNEEYMSQELIDNIVITHEEGNSAVVEENDIDNSRNTVKHTETDMQCPHCSKVYSRPKAFKKHLAKHSEEGYICPYCQRDCNCLSALEIHVRCHTKERPFPCQHCDKAFATAPRLKEHTMRHLGNKPHECSICFKAFVSKNELNDHLRIHTGERPHKCQLCDKAFIAKYKLLLHMRKHTGERPHKCEFCTKTFMRKQHLSEHVKTHSIERPYVCPYCSMSFVSKWNCNKHVDRHTGEKPYEPSQKGNSPYKCEFCNVVFGSSRTLNKHLEQPHQM